MLDLLQTGKYGVLTQQKLLNTTSNNINNVNTQGYTRQETHVYTSTIDWGVGSTVTRRMYDKYVQREMFRDQGNVGFYDAFATGLSTVDSMLSNKDTSINSKLDSLFTSMEAAVQNTTSVASRRELLTQFQTIVDRYNTLNYNIRNQITDINNKVDDTAAEINNLVRGLYEVNKQVAKLGSAGLQSDIGMQLVDERDRLVDAISNLVDVQVTTEDDGSFSLYLGNGQLLVNHDTYGTLQVNQHPADPTRKEVGLYFNTPSKTKIEVSHAQWGGKLGGYLAASDQMRQAMRELGQNALAFADAMNEQNRGGITMTGFAGDDLITIPKVPAWSSNDAFSMTVTFDRGAGEQIHSADYRITWDNTTNPPNPQLWMTDASGVETQVQLDAGDITADAQGNMVIKPKGHGVTFSFNRSHTDIAAADVEFRAQPTFDAAFQIKCNITKPEDFGFASAIRTNVNKHPGNATPTLVGVTQMGTGANVAGEEGLGLYIDPTTKKPMLKDDAPNFVRFEKDPNNPQAPGQYVIYHKDNAGQLTKLGHVDADGFNGQNIFENATWNNPARPAGYPGYEVSFVGTVENGSSFDIEINTDGINDNSNGNLLAGLKQEELVYSSDGVKVSFTEDYADLTSSVGSAVMSAATDLKASQAKCEQSQNLYYSVAGVNLDEEAANLIRFQQSYSACARIISASQTIFDALINAV
ncbi:flagellar hook-associated protein FlgK [Anaerobiospirillum succiniciproducens]|uniref:flagellar hook-associated protein FlgK n=1 Tax=Anaerobiospirillum succiniciproducens TaxID=13335 RepID=UPI0003F4B320|nr:flagellar hook-associated protein FlgK [Anaerobiospirillum succiniciproducens]